MNPLVLPHPTSAAGPPLPAFALPVRLWPVRRTEPPTFWVIRDNPEETLRTFVQTANEALVDSLDFAVGPEGKLIALRGRKSRTGPPTLMVAAAEYTSFLRFDTVFLSAGTRMVPLLRRDALRDWLVRPDRITWVSPRDRGVSVESLPAAAFQPLREWVEYRRAASRRRSPWRTTGELLAMESFSEIAQPAAKKAEKQKVRTQDDVEVPLGQVLPRPVVKGTAPPKPAPPKPREPVESLAPSVAVVRLREVETQFLAIDGPIDAPERLALWPQLGALASSAGLDEDAALAWGNALWVADEPATAQQWGAMERRRSVRMEAVLQSAEPRIADLRTLAVLVIEAGTRGAWPDDLRPHLARIVRSLEDNDARLPVRLAWLAWLSFARLAGGDVLSLSRARDRLLRDLMDNGLRRDRDFPPFLRVGQVRVGTGGGQDNARIMGLRAAAWDWCRGRSSSTGEWNDGNPVQRVFVDLTFAFAFARIGEHQVARTILADVGEPYGGGKRRSPGMMEPYQRWLWQAYRERVQRQINGDPPAAPLSAELRRSLDDLSSGPWTTQRTSCDRFLQFSRILEPFDRVDPYRTIRQTDELGRALADLGAFTAPARKRDSAAAQLDERFRDLFRRHTGVTDTLRILRLAVPMSVRIGESFALECVEKVRPTFARLGRWLDVRDLSDRVELLESAVAVVAHFGRQALVEGLMTGLFDLVGTVKGEVAAWLMAASLGNGFRLLSRLGLKPAAQALFERMADGLTEQKTVKQLLNTPGLNRGVYLPALMRLAGGWFYFGSPPPANAALAAVRAELFEGTMSPEPRIRLAEAYAAALGHAPLDEAVRRYEELFERLPVTMPTFESGTIHRLRVIEAVALATAAEDFVADARFRRWADEDEYVVRRRIHADVDAAVRAAGLAYGTSPPV
jgi:cellulose synthase operon protein C